MYGKKEIPSPKYPTEEKTGKVLSPIEAVGNGIPDFAKSYSATNPKIIRYPGILNLQSVMLGFVFLFIFFLPFPYI